MKKTTSLIPDFLSQSLKQLVSLETQAVFSDDWHNFSDEEKDDLIDLGFCYKFGKYPEEKTQQLQEILPFE